MDDTLVSSRISKAKKDAGVAVLESLGATTSQLINCAFDYVIQQHALPSAAHDAAPDQEGFEAFLADTALSIDWTDEQRSYKQILRDGKAADYESLA